MKRKIIKIDEEKCNGCGDCVPNCAEGAIQIIDGKARLISDMFCDGLGACVGHCPEGAITIEEREAEEYNERKVMDYIVKQGPNTIKAHLRHMKDHGEMKFLQEAIDYLKEKNIPVPDLEKSEPLACGCPGSKQQVIIPKAKQQSSSPVAEMDSELRQWPVQLALLNPNAPYFENADLLVAADCVPFAYPNFHQRFLKDKILVVFCPKLDKTLDMYVEKLATLFANKNIKSVTVLHMEVPCCGGTGFIVQKALQMANKTMMVKDYTISLNGEIL